MENCESLNNILSYKEENGIVYAYFNQKALDISLYNRAKERSNNFTAKDKYDSEKNKRTVRLDDISVQKHSILYRPVSDGEFVSKGEVVLNLGLSSLYTYFKDNNISEFGTWLSSGIKIYSCFDGYFTNLIKDNIIGRCNLGNTINDGDLLFTLKLAAKTNDSESLIKEVRFGFKLFPDSFLDEMHNFPSIKINKWLVQNYSYVNEGDDILTLAADNTYSAYATHTLKSPFSGLLVQKSHYSPYEKLIKDQTLFKVYPDESYLEEEHPYCIDVQKDDFTKELVVKCRMYCGGIIQYSSLGYNIKRLLGHSIHINFEYIGGHFFLLLNYDRKDIDINKYCSLHLLLEDSSVIIFNPVSNPVKGSPYSCCRFQVSLTDIEKLSTINFVKWRILNKEGIVLKLGDNMCCVDDQDPTDTTLKLSYIVFRKFVNDLKQTVIGNITEKEMEVLTENQSDDTKCSLQNTCYVYLMIDTTNNFHKIGISNNPQYREHTLQSDKPTIELLCAKEFPTRAIAEAIEESLHKVYAHKRIRGEWFKLDDTDLEVIKQTLK